MILRNQKIELKEEFEGHMGENDTVFARVLEMLGNAAPKEGVTFKEMAAISNTLNLLQDSLKNNTNEITLSEEEYQVVCNVLQGVRFVSFNHYYFVAINHILSYVSNNKNP